MDRFIQKEHLVRKAINPKGTEGFKIWKATVTFTPHKSKTEKQNILYTIYHNDVIR